MGNSKNRFFPISEQLTKAVLSYIRAQGNINKLVFRSSLISLTVLQFHQMFPELQVKVQQNRLCCSYNNQ